MRRVTVMSFLLAVCAVALAMSCATPAHAGTFPTRYCSSTGGSGALPAGYYSSTNSAGDALHQEAICPSDGTINTGLFVRTRNCAEFAAIGNWTYGCRGQYGLTGRGGSWTIAIPQNDANVWIDSATLTRAYRTSVKQDSNGNQLLSNYEWYIHGISNFRDPGALGPMEFEACNRSDGNPVECIRGAGGVTGDPTITPAVAGRHSIAYVLQCESPAQTAGVCYSFNGSFVNYAARFNLRQADITVRDNGSPAVGSQTTNWNQSCWYTSAGASACGAVAGGNFETSAFFSDTTGMAAWAQYRNGAGLASGGFGCAVWPSGGYQSGAPCSNQTLTRSFNGGFSQGANTLQIDAADPAGNPASFASTLRIDDTAPVIPGGAIIPDPDSATPACASAGSGITNPDNGTGDATNAPLWIRGSARVKGFGCDTQSGIAGTSTIQYRINGGSWQTLCNLPAAAAGVVSEATCSFDSTPYTQGTTVEFRSNVINGANITTASTASDVRRIDNTAPANPVIHFRGLTPAASARNIDVAAGGTGWSNASSTEAYWDQDDNSANGRQAVTDSTGSGTYQVEYTYSPDVDAAPYAGRPGNCATLAPATRTGTATETLALAENRGEECRQGQHRISVRFRDNAGNWSSPTTATFRYDSYPTADTKSLAFPCAGHVSGGGTPLATDCFRPETMTASPSGWTATNNFAVAWRNPTYNGVTEAPIREAIIRGPFAGSTGLTAVPGSGDLNTYNACTASGGNCNLTGVQINPAVEGSYQFKLWLRDAAGNADEEQSESVTLNYQDNECVRP